MTGVGAKGIFMNEFSHPLLRIWADGGYQGDFQKYLKRHYSIVVEIVKSIKYTGRIPKRYQLSPKDKLQLQLFQFIMPKISREDELKNFKIVKWRWIVERTLAWLSRNRRLSKDYESKSESSESCCYLAMIRLMLTRLTKRE